MLLRHATTSPLGLLFTAFEIASLLSSYIPLQVKWCSTRAERKKGEGTGGQKEQRPRQGRRGLGEGEGQGQRGNRGPNRRQGKEGRRTHGANQGQRQGQAGQGQGPTQVVALNKAEGSKWRARILAVHPPICDEYAPKEQARRCTFSRRGWEPVTSSSFGGCFLTFRMTKKRKLREEEEDEYRHHKLDRDRADCRDLGKLIMPGRDPGGFLLTIVIGMIGAVVGGFVVQLLGGRGVTGFNIWSILVATLGAIILLALYRAFAGGRRRRV